MAGATGSLGCLHQSLAKGLIKLVAAIGARQQQALRIRQMGVRSGGAQREDPLYDSFEFEISGNQAIIVQLAKPADCALQNSNQRLRHWNICGTAS